MAKDSSATPGGLTQSFKAIVSIAKEAFKGLPPNTKAIVALAAFVAILLLAVDIILGFAGRLPPWGIVSLFIVSLIFFVFVAVLLVQSETAKPPASTCRRIPIYPPRADALTFLHAALEAIRQQAHKSIQKSVPNFSIDSVRTNIFLLAKTQTNDYKLVIHPELGINMNFLPEWNTQFRIGQGSTGQAFKNNTAGLTRRKSDKAGQWDKVQEMTDELKAKIDKNLKWLLSIPLIPPGKFECLGILNIDGLAPIEKDDPILEAGAAVRKAVSEIAEYLDLQPYICVDLR